MAQTGPDPDKNQRLKYQLDRYQTTCVRKRVQVNLNERFSNVESIKAAIDRAAALQAQQTSILVEKVAEKGAIVAAALAFSSMCTEWQI